MFFEQFVRALLFPEVLEWVRVHGRRSVRPYRTSEMIVEMRCKAPRSRVRSRSLLWTAATIESISSTATGEATLRGRHGPRFVALPMRDFTL